MMRLITDPIYYSSEIEKLGPPSTDPIEYDRVFEIDYKKSIPSTIYNKIVYKPCSIKLIDRPEDIAASLFPALTCELESMLNMTRLDDEYNISIDSEHNQAVWTHRLTGDALMLSPNQQKILHPMEWSVRGLLNKKLYVVGYEPWLVWLAQKENIKIVQWRSVFLTTSSNDQETLILQRGSLIDNYCFSMSSSLYNLLKDNWPIEKVSELDENTIFVKGTEIYDQYWAESISYEKMPFIYLSIDNELSNGMIQYKLFKAGSLSNTLPIYRSNIKLVQLFASKSSDIEEFKSIYNKVTLPELSIVNDISKAVYQIPVSDEGIIYYSSGDSKPKKLKPIISKNIEKENLKELYKCMGFM